MENYSKSRKKEFYMEKSSSINTLDSSHFDESEHSIQNNSTPMSTSDARVIRKQSLYSTLRPKQQTTQNVHKRSNGEQYFLFNYKLLRHVETFEKLTWNNGETMSGKHKANDPNHLEQNEFFRKVFM